MTVPNPQFDFEQVLDGRGRPRDLQELTARVTLSLLSGWLPHVSAVQTESARRRAGYWLTLVMGWASDTVVEQGLRRCLERLPVASDRMVAPFPFYPTPRGGAIRPGNDELARRWGLSAGCRPVELRQAVQRLARQRRPAGSPRS